MSNGGGGAKRVRTYNGRVGIICHIDVPAECWGAGIEFVEGLF